MRKNLAALASCTEDLKLLILRLRGADLLKASAGICPQYFEEGQEGSQEKISFNDTRGAFEGGIAKQCIRLGLPTILVLLPGHHQYDCGLGIQDTGHEIVNQVRDFSDTRAGNAVQFRGVRWIILDFCSEPDRPNVLLAPAEYVRFDL